MGSLGESPLMLANLDAEKALLGALLVNNAAYHRVSAFLRAEHFASPVHGRIFGAIGALVVEGRAVDARILKPRFDRDPDLSDDGGAAYLGRLQADVLAVENAEEYGRAVYDMALRRYLRTFAQQIQERAETDLDTGRTADEIVTEALGKLSKLSAAVQSGTTKRELAVRIADSLKRQVAIYRTGLANLDDAIGGGLIAGKCYGVAARKKVGKTVLLGTISHNLNRAGTSHLFVSGEMSDEEIEQRNIAREMNFNSIKFLTRDYAPLVRLVGEYATSVPDHTVFEHRPGVTFDELRRMIARAVQRGIKGAIVDYWQLVQGRGKHESEEQHMRNVAQYLADVARREGIFVITAAQVNQEGNTRGGEGLKLACDMYLTLHREKEEPGAWLEMEESRFTRYVHVGDEANPGLWLHKNGPHFSDDPPPYHHVEAQ